MRTCPSFWGSRRYAARKAWISARIGGDQIDYADESEAVRSRFVDALSKHGLTPQMDGAYEAELADLPPKAAE